MHEPYSQRVLFYDDPLFREHDAGTGHPERPERLDAIRFGLDSSGTLARLVAASPRPATTQELLRVHTEGHVTRMAATKGRHLALDPDTGVGPRSYDAALLAAGAVVDAVDSVLAGEAESALCAVRPPGHHAEADRAMGFCLFNNVAVGAAHALFRGLRKVMIVDFDVHHGNGTQSIFYEDPRVLFVSSHAYPFYPGTGALDEVGTGAGAGYTVNLPLANGTGDREYVRLYRDIVKPVGTTFAPELVLVSMGFDAHALDPLGCMTLTSHAFSALAKICLEIAEVSARGRVVFVLEGGYDLNALASCSVLVARLLLGDNVHTAVSPAVGAAFEDEIARLKRELARHWPVLA